MTITIPLSGNLTADPDLRYTPSGKAVARLRVAHSTWKTVNGQREEGPTTFLTVIAWNDLAIHVAESLKKGQSVIVHGRLEQRDFEHNGENRTVYEVKASDIGPSLKFGTTDFQPAQKREAGTWGEGNQAPQDTWGEGSQVPQPTQPTQGTWGQPTQPGGHQGHTWGNQ